MIQQQSHVRNTHHTAPEYVKPFAGWFRVVNVDVSHWFTCTFTCAGGKFFSTCSNGMDRLSPTILHLLCSSPNMYVRRAGSAKPTTDVEAEDHRPSGCGDSR